MAWGVLFLGVVIVGAMSDASASDPPLSAEIPHWRAVLYESLPKSDDPIAHLRVSHAGRVLIGTDLPKDAAHWYSPMGVRFAPSTLPGHVIVWADVVMSAKYIHAISVLYDFSNATTVPQIVIHDWNSNGAPYTPSTIAKRAVGITAITTTTFPPKWDTATRQSTF